MISCKSCTWFYLTFCVLNNIVSYTQSHVSSYRREEVKSAREVYIFAKSPSELKEFFWRNASYLVLNFVPPYSTPPPSRMYASRHVFRVLCNLHSFNAIPNKNERMNEKHLSPKKMNEIDFLTIHENRLTLMFAFFACTSHCISFVGSNHYTN